MAVRTIFKRFYFVFLLFCPLGDRILAVNGQSLEQVTHEFAVGVLKNSPPRVELVVSQSPHNVSSFGMADIDMLFALVVGGVSS